MVQINPSRAKSILLNSKVINSQCILRDNDWTLTVRDPVRALPDRIFGSDLQMVPIILATFTRCFSKKQKINLSMLKNIYYFFILKFFLI